MHLFRTFTAILTMGLALAASAADELAPDQYTRIEFDTRTTQDVANDTMRATLFVELTDVSAAVASSRVIHEVNNALRLLRQRSKLKIETGRYQTYPSSKNGKITGWRARAELMVESNDFAEVGEAISEISSIMQPGNVDFFVSSERISEVETMLTDQAIAMFLRKARNIATSFGAQGFRVANVRVINNHGAVPLRAAPRAMSTTAMAPVPEFAPGATTLGVTVSGTILIAR